MKVRKDDLISILENGFSDIDEKNRFEVVAKVNLHFIKCPGCGLFLDLTEFGLPIEVTDFREAGNLIKSLRWGFLNEAVEDGYVETDVFCPDCLISMKG